MEMEMGTTGGMTETINRIIAAQDSPSYYKDIQGFYSQSLSWK